MLWSLSYEHTLTMLMQCSCSHCCHVSMHVVLLVDSSLPMYLSTYSNARCLCFKPDMSKVVVFLVLSCCFIYGSCIVFVCLFVFLFFCICFCFVFFVLFCALFLFVCFLLFVFCFFFCFCFFLILTFYKKAYTAEIYM